MDRRFGKITTIADLPGSWQRKLTIKKLVRSGSEVQLISGSLATDIVGQLNIRILTVMGRMKTRIARRQSDWCDRRSRVLNVKLDGRDKKR